MTLRSHGFPWFAKLQPGEHSGRPHKRPSALAPWLCGPTVSRGLPNCNPASVAGTPPKEVIRCSPVALRSHRFRMVCQNLQSGRHSAPLTGSQVRATAPWLCSPTVSDGLPIAGACHPAADGGPDGREWRPGGASFFAISEYLPPMARRCTGEYRISRWRLAPRRIPEKGAGVPDLQKRGLFCKSGDTILPLYSNTPLGQLQ